MIECKPIIGIIHRHNIDQLGDDERKSNEVDGTGAHQLTFCGHAINAQKTFETIK